MNADSTFQIGKDHNVCEDYALAKAAKDCNGVDYAYAIVCDGCSASPDVDLGARILALSAREVIMWDFMREDAIKFGKRTIDHAHSIREKFPALDPDFLDATLLAAYVENKKLTVFGFGDGVLIHKTKTDTRMFHISLSSGAPDYLSYHLDKNRKASYDALVDNKKEVWTSFDDKTQYAPLTPIHYSATLEEGDVVAVISDGINSFRKAETEEIDWKAMMNEFIGFKNFEGEFVKRRILAMKRKCVKENWYHHDDISIAAIVV